MPLPPWLPADDAQDNWETTAWDFASPVDLFDGTAPFRKTGTRQPQPTTTVDGAKLPKNP
jgi:hypothetical protein